MMAGSQNVLVAAILIGTLLLFPVPAHGEATFECKPTVYPLQNFKAAVARVQDDTRELSNMFHGPNGKYLDDSIANSLPGNALALDTLLDPAFAPVELIYPGDKPVTAVLRESLKNPTLDYLLIRGVENDLRVLRTNLLRQRDFRVSAASQLIENSKRISDFFGEAIGLLVKIRNGGDGIRDTYLVRAFDHLDACLRSCGGPKGFDLTTLKDRFQKLYAGLELDADPSSNDFAAGISELKAGQGSINLLAQDLARDMPDLISYMSQSDDSRASRLQEAADLLADVKYRGTQPERLVADIEGAISLLNQKVRPSDKPPPDTKEIRERIKSVVARALGVQGFIDRLLSQHSNLVNELQEFLKKYTETYTPGCRAPTVER
jgi:hypothetical protein